MIVHFIKAKVQQRSELPVTHPELAVLHMPALSFEGTAAR